MDLKERQDRVSKVVFGLLAIGLGVLFMLDNLGRVEAGRLSHYWPLVMIGFGLTSLVAPKDDGDQTWGALLTGLGAFFMLRRFGLIRWSFWQLWPMLFVLVGFVLLVQSLWGPKKDRATSETAGNGGER